MLNHYPIGCVWNVNPRFGLYQERLKNEQLGQTEEVSLGKIDDKRLQPVGTVNLLARVNNSGSSDTTNEDGEVYENNSSGAKLHQLLDTSPRTDAVAAG